VRFGAAFFPAFLPFVVFQHIQYDGNYSCRKEKDLEKLYHRSSFNDREVKTFDDYVSSIHKPVFGPGKAALLK